MSLLSKVERKSKDNHLLDQDSIIPGIFTLSPNLSMILALQKISGYSRNKRDKRNRGENLRNHFVIYRGGLFACLFELISNLIGISNAIDQTPEIPHPTVRDDGKFR